MKIQIETQRECLDVSVVESTSETLYSERLPFLKLFKIAKVRREFKIRLQDLSIPYLLMLQSEIDKIIQEKARR